MPPPLQVTFPGIGELVRNRAGRIEFVFEQQLVEALELGLAPVSAMAWLTRKRRMQHAVAALFVGLQPASVYTEAFGELPSAL